MNRLARVPWCIVLALGGSPFFPSMVSAQDSTQVELSDSSFAAGASEVSATFAIDFGLRVPAGETVILHTCQGSPRYQVRTYESAESVGDLLQTSYCPLSFANAEELVGPTFREYSLAVVVLLGERSPWFLSRADLEGPLTLVLAGDSREVLKTQPFLLRF